MLILTLLLPALLVLLLLALLTFWLGVDFLPEDLRLDRSSDDLKNAGDDSRLPLPPDLLFVGFESIEEDDETIPLVW